MGKEFERDVSMERSILDDLSKVISTLVRSSMIMIMIQATHTSAI